MKATVVIGPLLVRYVAPLIWGGWAWAWAWTAVVSPHGGVRSGFRFSPRHLHPLKGSWSSNCLEDEIQIPMIGNAHITFPGWVEMEAYRRPDIEADELKRVMRAVNSACKTVSSLVRRAVLNKMTGNLGTSNIQGEVQKVLDVASNEVMLYAFCSVPEMLCAASEEEDAPRLCQNICDKDRHTGKYGAVFDPLDGSSNIQAGLPCGTIFGVHRLPPLGAPSRDEMATVTQQGRQLIAAGYILYGTQTTMVVTIGHGAHGFTLCSNSGEFVLTQPDIRIPLRGNTYSVNEARSQTWDVRLQSYLSDIRNGKGETGKPYQFRYKGALVADIHSILHSGGIFMYPANEDNPNGKLRLLYENNPISMIIEQAGGKASTGYQRVRTVVPRSVHQRTPLFIGSKEDVDEVCERLAAPLLVKDLPLDPIVVGQPRVIQYSYPST